MSYNNTEKSKLAYTGSLVLTEKTDKKGNKTGMKGYIVPLQGSNGVTSNCLVMPLDQNPGLYVNPKDGSVSLDLAIFENSQVRFEQTHFIRPSLGKRAESMTDEQRRNASPIIGNLKVFTPKPQAGAPAPQAPASPYGAAPMPQNPYQGAAPVAASPYPAGAPVPQAPANPYQQPAGAPAFHGGVPGDMPQF